jgi:hypothetical protein
MEAPSMTLSCGQERRRNWYTEEKYPSAMSPLRYEPRRDRTRRSYAHLLASRRRRANQQAFFRALEEQLAERSARAACSPAFVPASKPKEVELPLAIRFRRYVEDWERDTCFTSSISEVVQHPSYNAIIAMGESAVPLILEDLRKTGNFWFPALIKITHENPVNPVDSGNIKRMTKAWIKWGKEKGRI